MLCHGGYIMFKINRIRSVITTDFLEDEFGFDYQFNKKLNFISSLKNTQGKSSVIEAIVYCLGMEELLGGINEHVLKPVFRNELKYKGKMLSVIASKFYLEIENKKGCVITIERHGKSESFKPTLMTVYYGTISQLLAGEKITFEDMYVHSKGSATNSRGFHSFLETFIGWQLPNVPTYDDKEKKLYMQLLFSAFVVEQKRGWGGFLNNINTKFGIKDANKRVVEFILGLNSLENEKKKIECKTRENLIRTNWEKLNRKIIDFCKSNNFIINGLPEEPAILDNTFKSKINIYKHCSENSMLSLDDYIHMCEYKYNELNTSEFPLVSEKSKELELKIINLQSECAIIEKNLLDNRQEKLDIQTLIKNYETSIAILKTDLQHNSDALKIKKMGSLEELNSIKKVCPICHQSINDVLYDNSNNLLVMDIEENINHIKGQLGVIEFAKKREEAKYNYIERSIIDLESQLIEKRSLLRNIKNDLYSPDNKIAESVIREKIIIENKITQANEVKGFIENSYTEYVDISHDYAQLISDRQKLPKECFTDTDEEKISIFENMFKNNLKEFGFSSTDISGIKISRINLMPEIDGFKLAYDASASDYIRAIWAFNLALMQASLKCSGNHCNILFFDEPKQQSATQDHASNFFNKILSINGNYEVIIGITLQDEKTNNAVKKLKTDDANVIEIEDYSVKPLI